jgi:hypothetical protein
MIQKPGRGGKFFGAPRTGKMVSMPRAASRRLGHEAEIGIIESGARDWASQTDVDGCLRSMRS